MALVNCKECGQQISDSASVCPHCGAPIIAKMPQNLKYCPQCGASNPGARNRYPKDRLTAGLLAIFLGGLGIHYFYLEKSTAGLLSILLSLCTCGVWQIVMLIQGIIILTMTDDGFNEKYYNTDKTFPLF